jgi:hypothetical protein
LNLINYKKLYKKWIKYIIEKYKTNLYKIKQYKKKENNFIYLIIFYSLTLKVY